MAIVIKPITVEVSKPNVFQAIAAKQNDSNSRFLKVTFANEGEKITVISSAKVTINAERKDGQSNSFFGEVNDDGTVTVPVHSWILALPGYVNCDISIIEEDSKLTSTTFTLLVEEASHGSDDISNDKQYDVLGDLINEVKELTPQYTKEDIDPVFANNSWELIKWICQNDDPSRYWKVGDYKMLKVGKDKLVGTNFVDWYGMDSLMSQTNDIALTFSDWDKLCAAIGNQSGTYIIEFVGDDALSSPYTIFKENDGTREEVWSGEFYEAGIDIPNGGPGPDKWILEVEAISTEYPLQIIGFNHDKVTNPYEYGKARAGITLQLGCSRSQYGDTKASLFSGSIDKLMTPKGYFFSPTRVRDDYTLGATNWADGGFRIALQDLFKNTDVEPFMVTVQKYTSQFFYMANQWEAPMLTEDRVFLLSENEMFGKQHQAPAQEGEHYEFYKDGYSKFMWHQDLLDSKTDNALLWLRSAQKEQVNETTKDSISACCCYLTVNSRDPLSVNYQPSAAGNVSEARAGFIAPCICL